MDQSRSRCGGEFLEVVMESNFGVVMELYHIRKNKYSKNIYLYKYNTKKENLIVTE